MTKYSVIKSTLLYLAVLIMCCACAHESAQQGLSSPKALPQRIVSLVPSATELICSLGAIDRLVGVTLNDHYPPEVEDLPKVGDQTIDSEKLVSLRPDLIVLDTEFNSDRARYKKLGFKTLELRSRRLADIESNLRLLGPSLGLEQAGKKSASKFTKELEEVGQAPKKLRIFIEIWGNPLMTVGSHTLPDDLLKKLGLENIYSDQDGYFQIDPEDLINRKPQLIILPISQVDPDKQPKSIAQKILSKAGLASQLIVVDGATFTNPTPRVIDGMRFIKEALKKSEATDRAE